MQRYGLTTNEVIDRWSIGHEAGTASANVPGGRRLEAVRDPGTGDLLLYSYRTIVAVRRQVIAPDGLSEVIVFALTPKKYSVTTSKVMGAVRRVIEARGYIQTVETQDVSAAVPGRWGGFGPAWHPTGIDLLPFNIWAKARWTKSQRYEEPIPPGINLHGGVTTGRPFGERDGMPTSAR